jgi:hypothetical protein
MSAINKWSVFCETENTNLEILSISGNPPPLICPNNLEHILTPERTFLLQVIEDRQVKIKEESIPTQGFFKVEGKIIDCPANTVSHQDTGLKQAVSILAFFISPSPNNFKDVVDIYINLGTIGILVEPIVSGSTTLKIATPIFSNIPLGFEILVNGTPIGEVLFKNNETQTLTMDTIISQDFPANSTIILRNRMMKNFIIGLSPRYDLGISIIGGSYMSPNYNVTVVYTNKSLTEDKELIYHIEYLY